MQTSVSDLVKYMTSVDFVVASARLTDTEKREVLGELLNTVPPEPFCRATAKTRAITIKAIEEAINGLKPTQTASKKPVKSGARKASTKATKK